MEKKGGPGPTKRFTEIEGRLKTGKYDAATRKANRTYLAGYLKSRGAAGTAAIEARKAAASNLVAKINTYKSPVDLSKVKAAPKAVTKKKKRSKTPPPPVRPSTPPPQESDLYKQVDVKGDGNCYYRALYRAAADHEDPKLLDKVFTILGADKKKMKDEATGHVALRKAIADIYRTRFLTKDGPYEVLADNYGTLQYRLYLNEATPSQAAIYKKILKYISAKDGKKQFYTDLAKVIGTDMEYASEIDYFVISDILDAGGVKVVSTQTSPKSGIFDGKPALFIKRLSYDHYNYWKIKKVVTKIPSAISVSSSDSNNSSNNEEDEDRRHELLEELEKRMDKHTRCVEKCKAYGKKVEATKVALKALGK